MGEFVLDRNLIVCSENKEDYKIIDLFKEKIQNISSVEYSNVEKNADIVLINNSALQEEEYVLEVNTEKINIEYSTYKGLYYAMQTFMQLLPAEVEGQKK